MMKLYIAVQRKRPYKPNKFSHRVKYLYEYAIMRENEFMANGHVKNPVIFINSQHVHAF